MDILAAAYLRELAPVNSRPILLKYPRLVPWELSVLSYVERRTHPFSLS